MFGRITANEISCSAERNKLLLTVCVPTGNAWTARRAVEAANRWLREKAGRTLTVAVGPARRSPDSNAYAWVLLDRLGEALGLPAVDIYRALIRDVPGNHEIIPVCRDAVDTWRRNWAAKGVGWQTESLGPGKLAGYENIVCYYGSSVYDRQQMARLLALIKAECDAQGIETKTPEEIARMNAQWGAAE